MDPCFRGRRNRSPKIYSIYPELSDTLTSPLHPTSDFTTNVYCPLIQRTVATLFRTSFGNTYKLRQLQSV